MCLKQEHQEHKSRSYLKKKTQTQNFERIKLKFSNFSQSTAMNQSKFLNPNFNFSTKSPKLKLSNPKKKKKKKSILVNTQQD